MALDVPKVFESEYKLACIVWEKEPISTHDLVALCAQKLGWKRTTTYTQLKRLTERGILENKNSVVTAIVPKEAVQIRESKEFLDRTFGGSLPGFIAAFAQSKALSKEDVEEIQRLIDAYKEES
mgnify:FL=1